MAWGTTDVPTTEAERAANRLHHISMLYVGSFVELCKGEPVGMLPVNYPGLRDVRDLIDQILYTRAEVNALTKLLVDAKLATVEQASAAMADNYEWFAQQKIKLWPGFKLTDGGIDIDVAGASEPPYSKN